MSVELSVIVCTHNPCYEYLNTVLEALKCQTLSLERWELLLIDNLSERILSSEIDLGWHVKSRHIREENLGLTPARLRGIEESSGEILVFVDDDNILNANYLKIALQIGKENLFLGVWGGQILPRFDEDPPEWINPYLHMLAIYEFNQDCWSNLRYAETNPCGAGMCVRKIVADKYVNLVRSDPRRMNIDRRGESLISCGDTDLAFTACDIGLGMGKFKDLKMSHLIPSKRLKEAYLLQLAQANGYSSVILRSFRDKIPPPVKLSLSKKLLQFLRLIRMTKRERRLYTALKKGEMMAIKELFDNIIY